MDDKILELLNQLVEVQKHTNQRLDNTNAKLDNTNSKLESTNLKLDRIENKLDAVVDQTADLTELRTEPKENLDKIIVEVRDVRKYFSNVEIITLNLNFAPQK